MAPSVEATTRRTRKSTSGSSPSKPADKENATVDMGAAGDFASAAAASRKKLRSKSMGPGGLDALKSTSGNRRVSLAAPSRPPPRSILKPTMPILADIPPLKPKGKGGAKGSPARGGDADNNTVKVALRTEEEQQAAAREREREERERAAREKEVKDHREARRKSLANRRVSFAAEATLHTFHEIEYMQDSTTSTESTARRASSVAAPSPFPDPGAGYPDAFAPSPSTTAADGADEDTLQKRRRRSSTGGSASALGFRDADDVVADDNTITSTVYDSDGGDGVEEDDDSDEGDNDDGDDDSDGENVASDSGESDSDEGDGATMVTVDADEMTAASVMSALSAVSSVRSASPMESTTDVDEALRLATQHAGAQADEHRRQRPLDEGEEAIPAFVGWGRKANAINMSAPPPAAAAAAAADDDDDNQRDEDTAMSMDMDVDMDMDAGMDMTQAMGGIIKPSPSRPEDEMSMDVTRVYGGILSLKPAVDLDSVASSPMVIAPNDDDATIGEAPMELTRALGSTFRDVDAESVDNEGLEDMSMELTTVLGGMLKRASFGASKSRRLSRRPSAEAADAEEDDADEAPMDMTTSVGKIFDGKNASPEHDENADDESALPEMEDATATMGMEITTALGGILKPASPTVQKNDTPTKTSPKRQAESATKPTTLPGPSTPQRSSPKRFVSSQSQSPKRRPASAAADKATTTPTSPPKMASVFSKSLFTQNPATGASTPNVVLNPQARRRQSAFAGAGPASPKIAEIFSRRSSLLDTAAEFVAGSSPKPSPKTRPAVAFAEEPSPRPSTPDRDGTPGGAPPQDDREATQNLKDLIQNLSPKKNPLKGRKSLHVGSARGILGKRPLELDDDADNGDDSFDDDGMQESQNFVKRLKGGEPSPVKNIRLQQPPSAMETIGRSSRSRRSPAATPQRADAQSTPRRGALGAVDPDAALKYYDDGAAGKDAGAEVALNDAGADDDEDGVADEDAGERIHLQDFLKLANIHFMELDTTKRRATEGPGGAFKDKHGGGGGESRLSTDDDGRPKDPAIESLVTTVCKVPLLDMYQHACRELKNYIGEGRAIMREIEAETFENNPPIFREYTAATAEMRAQMDNQFKNIKIFARLQSKKQWYEWRTKLHEGLQEGMLKTLRDLEADQEVLRQRREQVDAVYPALRAEYEALEREREQLERFAAQLGGDDREALIAARVQKRQLAASIDARQDEAARLEAEMQASKARVAAMKTEREQYVRELDEAKRVQEERRRWTQQEISSLKSQVDALEKKSGWAVTGAQGTTLSLAYRRSIELVFDVAAFRPGQPNAQIDLWYIGHTRMRDPQPCSRETEFFLQCIRDHVRALRQAETHPGRLLKVVRASWDIAQQATNQIRHLHLTFPTTTTKTSDTSLAVTASVLLAPLRTKVEVTLHLRSSVGWAAADGAGDGAGGDARTAQPRGLRIAVTPEARIVYGEPFHAAKMSEFLAARIGRRVAAVAPKRAGGSSSSSSKARPADLFWVDAVEELKGKLLARGRKQAAGGTAGH